MSTVQDSIATYLRETIDQGISESLPRLCPIAAGMIKTSKGVVRDGLGRGWATKHTYEGSICGTHHWLAASGGDVDHSGANNGSGFSVYSAGRSWPGLADMTGPSLIQRTVSLVEGRGNYPLPLDLLQTDLQDAAVGKLVTLTKKGMATRINLAQIHSLWKLNTGNAIGKITGDGTAIATTTTGTYTLTDGRVRSFYPGLTVRLYKDSTGPSTRLEADGAEGTLVVSKVDYLAKEVTFMATNSCECTPVAATTYWVLPRNSATAATDSDAEITNGVDGFIDWHKAADTGVTLFGGSLSLASYPQFGSINDQTYSGPLTSDHMNLLIGGFDEATGMDLDTIVMTQGMQLAFLQNVTDTQQLIRYNVDGKAPKVVGGFDGMGYMYNGKVYPILTSPCAHTGKLWVLKLGNGNYKKYVPPKMPGTTSGGEAGAQEVEFVGKTLGYASDIFVVPQGTTGAPTDRLQAPYTVKMQYAPEQVQAICAGVFDEWLYTA